MYDVIVGGAGPAGLGVAIGCRNAGMRVLVCDPKSPPIDKACGEGIMPRGVELLGALGVEIGRFSELRGIRFVDGEDALSAPFECGHGWGVRRAELSRALVARAEELGVETRWGAPVRGFDSAVNRVCVEVDRDTFEARWLIGADGLHSPIRRRLGSKVATPDRALARSQARFGLRRHFRMAPWTDYVEVHLFRGGEVYTTPVADDEVGVSILASPPLDFDAWLERVPKLREKLRGQAVASTVRGSGPLCQAVASQVCGRVALVGDAAGYVDALTGEGVSLSLACANALATALARDDLAHYVREYRRLTLNYRVMTRLMLGLTKRPALRTRLIRAFQSDPRLMTKLLSINEGTRPLSSLSPVVAKLTWILTTQRCFPRFSD